MEWTNALVFPAVWLHAMIAPDEVGQGHCVADALDKVSIKQGRKESQEETRCEGGADSIVNAMNARKQKRHSPENCPCWAVRSFEGVEKVGRGVFRICQMYAAFRLGVVHLANLLVFFLTNRGQTFSGVGTPFASLFLQKPPSCVGFSLSGHEAT